MVKIRDRVLLGVISGLGGGLVKNAVSELLISRNLAEYGGPARAAGMLVPAHKITTPRGRIVGWLADTTISGMLGVASSLYPLGKAPSRHPNWWSDCLDIYGALSRMGVTQVQDPEPKTVLSEFLAHAVYGAVSAAIATTLGDEGLFNGQIPWSPIGLRQQLGHGSTSASRQVQIQRRYMTY